MPLFTLLFILFDIMIISLNGEYREKNVGTHIHSMHFQSSSIKQLVFGIELSNIHRSLRMHFFAPHLHITPRPRSSYP